MGLAAAWRRQSVWAAAVTLFVPGVLMLAVATALLGGGFRGLGALTQIVTGPQVPEARLAAEALRSHRSSPLPAVPSARPVEGRATQASGATPAAPGASRPSGPLATVPPRRSTAGPLSATGSPGAPATPQQPQSRPAPGPVRAVGEQVAGGVGTLPAPVGPAGREAVTTVLDIVAPPPSPAAEPVEPQQQPPAAPAG